jgi:GntR family transcriptional regulator/MocR family aminotransferase
MLFKINSLGGMKEDPLSVFSMEPLLPFALQLPVMGSRVRLREFHRQLRAAIVEGRLGHGVRLPSTRALASAYGMSRNTAVGVYGLLASEGYVTTLRGSATRVNRPLPRSSRSPMTGYAARLARPPASSRVHEPLVSPSALVVPGDSFRIGVPDERRFPIDAWRRIHGRVLRAVGRGGALSADPQGQESLRHAIAQHVAHTRAVSCEAADLLVTSGAQQAFSLLAQVLVQRGRTHVAMEDPGYPRLRCVLAAAGARIANVPVDADGMIVDHLPARARVVCVTPSHQFPLGSILSAQRRGSLLDFARSRGAVIIEDDYDGEFRFDSRPLDSLQTLDRTASVFYVGTFSKSLLPALRVGYIVMPQWARESLVNAKMVSDGFSCTLTQDTLAALITEGHLARHVRKMQGLYAARRVALISGIQRHLGSWLQVVPSAAGLHIAAVATRSFNDINLTQAALRNAVQVHALSSFYAAAKPRYGLLFGYGAIEEPAIAAALTRLRAVFSD